MLRQEIEAWNELGCPGWPEPRTSIWGGFFFFFWALVLGEDFGTLNSKKKKLKMAGVTLD